MTIQEKLSAATPECTAFVLDFDSTIIHAFVDGENVPSLISILRSENILTEEYSQKALALVEKYRPIETDLEKSYAERLSAAESWWSEHEKLLVESELSLSSIQKAVTHPKLRIRKGFNKLFAWNKNAGIPIFIFSASGIGKDSIELFLKHYGFENIKTHIISNAFEWNELGVAIDRKLPCIHSMNKGEEVLAYFPDERRLLYSKDFIILAGDSLEDHKMATEKHHKAVYRIGFNCQKEIEKKNEMQKIYEGLYDVVLDANSECTDEINAVIQILTKSSK